MLDLVPHRDCPIYKAGLVCRAHYVTTNGISDTPANFHRFIRLSMEGNNLEPGTVLDAYRIVRVVGAGGFGVTYEAEDLNLGTTIAIKEYFPGDFATRTRDSQVRPSADRHSQTFEWGRVSFLEEARTLARFRHPSIVQIYRIFEANSTAYMVMAYERGASFERWLRDLGRPPSQAELDVLLAPLLDALELMHSNNFLHRDIAPDNIIIRDDTTPVLLDFGAARKTIAAKTHMLTGIFKHGYSPQEQYSTDGKFQGPWSDFYALGATFYRAATGRPPDEAPSRGIHDSLAPTAQTAKGEYRTAFLEGIDACLKLKPAERPQTAQEAREIFFGTRKPRKQTPAEKSTTNRDRDPAPDPTRIVPITPRWTRRQIGTATLILLAVALFGALMFTLRRGAEEEARATQTPPPTVPAPAPPSRTKEATGNTLMLRLKTGDVAIRLRPDLAPKHVERVKLLAAQGFYDGIKFHRVIGGFMAQTGDPTGTGTGGSKYPNLAAEFTSEPYKRGTVGAARTSDPNSANSQFFICFGDACRNLTGQYTVWGEVVRGMEHVDRIAKGEPPPVPDAILKASIAD